MTDELYRLCESIPGLLAVLAGPNREPRAQAEQGWAHVANYALARQAEAAAKNASSKLTKGNIR